MTNIEFDGVPIDAEVVRAKPAAHDKEAQSLVHEKFHSTNNAYIDVVKDNHTSVRLSWNRVADDRGYWEWTPLALKEAAGWMLRLADKLDDRK